VSWAWWDWPLTWLTNHRSSVLWHCWLGYVTRKTVSEMTYNVSSGTLNSTIPYNTYFVLLDKDESCPTADLSNIAHPNGTARWAVEHAPDEINSWKYNRNNSLYSDDLFQFVDISSYKNVSEMCVLIDYKVTSWCMSSRMCLLTDGQLNAESMQRLELSIV